MTRSVNKELLRQKVTEKGGSVTVSYEADVGHSTLEKMMAGAYQSSPRKRLIDKLSKYLNVKADDLFPVAAGTRAS